MLVTYWVVPAHYPLASIAFLPLGHTLRFGQLLARTLELPIE